MMNPTRFFTPFLLFVSLFVAGSSHAGWISSGGEIYQDETNPWFLSNVGEVKYCVTTGASFSVPKDQVSALVKSSIDYWKGEFSRALLGMTKGEFVLGTQTFTEVDCASSGSIDIRFQFGFETLSNDQKTFLQDPLKYIGVAVRTDYDTVQMRGKGFVFVASDTGANTYHNAGNLVTNAWQYPHLLQYVLLHEIGHIFGLQHAGGGVMAQTFLEQILNLKLYQVFSKIDVESYMAPAAQITQCMGVDLAARQWFGADSQSQCLVFTQNALGGYDVFSQTQAPTVPLKKADPVKLGVLKPIQLNMFDMRSKPVVILNLPEGQKVFTEEQTGFRNFMNGPTMVDAGGASTFIPANGTAPKSAYVRVSPTSLAVFGASGPMVKPVFLYNSLLAAALMVSTQGGNKK